MPFNSTGQFSLVPGTIVSEGMTVQPSQHNPPFQDVAAGLSQVVLRSGAAPWTGNQNANGNKVTGLAEGTSDTDAATVGQSAMIVGDFKDSTRTLNSNWLKRDGALYLRASYPELAELMPALPDGVAWSNVSSGILGTPKGIVINDDGFFVASQIADDTVIYKSSDGASFALVATVTGLSPYSFTHQGGVYILSGVSAGGAGVVSASTDATVWTVPTNAEVGNTAYACSYNGSVYVAVGNGGAIASSVDLITWTPRTSGTANILRNIKYLNGNFVVTGIGGTILTSPDGVTFTPRTSGTTENLFSVAYTGTLYVVVGTTGKIITSPDLATWTSRTSGTTLTLNDVVSSTSGLMVVGASGVCRISSDGLTWAVSITGVSSGLTSVSVNPDAQQEYYALGGGSFLKGVRTLPTQFRVPNDDPAYGWIRAR